MTEKTTYRTITYRLFPRRRAPEKLHRLAGACRFAWNECVGLLETQYRVSGRSLHGRKQMDYLSAAVRKANPWLGDLKAAQTLNQVGKEIAIAYERFFEMLKTNPELAGLPNFKKKWGTDPSIPLVSHGQSFKIDGDWLWMSRIGHMRMHRRGKLPYKLGKPKAGRVKFVGGYWTATIQYEVAEKDLPDTCERPSAVGIDRNVAANGAATSDRTVYRLPCAKLEELERRKKRYQRRMARRMGPKTGRPSNRYLKVKQQKRRVEVKMANIRRNWAHHVSRDLAGKHTCAVLEDLNTRGMTRSAKGDAESPGKNVKAKSGLNRSILGSGWGQLELSLGYKMRDGVVKVNPAYTSQTCAECGAIDKASRPSQAVFACTTCGHRDSADINAALNIQAAGHAVIGRGGEEGLARLSTEASNPQANSRKCGPEALPCAA